MWEDGNIGQFWQRTREQGPPWETLFVKPLAQESDQQFVYDDEEKHVDAPGRNLSHKEVLDIVIYSLKTNKQTKKSFAVHKDENYLQLVLELENLTEGKIVEQRCNQMQLTLDSFFQRHRKFEQRILNIPCLNTLKVAVISPCV